MQVPRGPTTCPSVHEMLKVFRSGIEWGPHTDLMNISGTNLESLRMVLISEVS